MVTNNNEKMQELTLEEKLHNLYELQRIDTEIDKIKTLRGELPLEVQDLEDEIAGLETRIENLKVELGELDKTSSTRKMDIKKAEEAIKKYSEQLDNVRNNREYDALSKEIELQEKRIREAQKAKAEKEALMEESKKRYEDKVSDLEAKKGELNDIINETHKDEESLQTKSEELAATIDERLLTAYRRIRSNARNGLAVVTVDRDACGGCFNKIPPQRQLDIRSRKKIIVCEYCGRILIDKYICDYDGSQQKADLEALLDAQKKKGRRLRKSEE